MSKTKMSGRKLLSEYEMLKENFVQKKKKYIYIYIYIYIYTTKHIAFFLFRSEKKEQ